MSSSPSLTWLPSIPCSAATAADVASLEQRFGVKLPAALRAIFVHHSGEQVQPSIFWAQNVTNGKWLRESMGPVYPAAAGSAEAEFGSYSAAVVNEMFAGDMVDEDELPAAISSPASGAAAAAAAATFFAFSESPNSGHLLVVDSRTARIMLIDPTRKRGPWIAGENIDDFLQRLTSSDSHDGEEDETVESADADAAEYDDEDEEGAYCCDGCGDELESTDSRFHCTTCANYDLCAACMKKASSRSASSSSAADDDHPASHTFAEIKGDDGEEQKE